MIFPEHTFIITWNLDYDDWTFSEWENEMIKLNDVIKQTDIRQSLLHPDAGHFCASVLRGSLNNWQNAMKGDRFFMYRVSEKLGFKKRIVGSGFFFDEPYLANGMWTSPKNGAAYAVKLDFDVMLNPRKTYDLLTEEVLELQFPEYDWSGETPDFMLDDKTAYMLDWKWYNYLRSLNLKCGASDFWCRAKDGIEEMYQWKDYRGDNFSYDMGRAAIYMPRLLTKIRPKEPIEVVRQRIKDKLKAKQEQESNEKTE